MYTINNKVRWSRIKMYKKLVNGQQRIVLDPVPYIYSVYIIFDAVVRLYGQLAPSRYGLSRAYMPSSRAERMENATTQCGRHAHMRRYILLNWTHFSSNIFFNGQLD